MVFYIYKTNKYLVSVYSGKENKYTIGNKSIPLIDFDVKIYETTPEKLLENKIIPQQSIELIHKYFDDLPAINQFVSGNKLVEFFKPPCNGQPYTLPGNKKVIHFDEFVCKMTIIAPNNTYSNFFGTGLTLENAFVSAYLDMKANICIYDSFSRYKWFFYDNN